VKTYSKRPPKIQTVFDLPLFKWQPPIHCPCSRAGVHLVRRYRVHPSIADVVAGLAGLGANGEAR
jgi:hypothetical protein